MPVAGYLSLHNADHIIYGLLCMHPLLTSLQHIGIVSALVINDVNTLSVYLSIAFSVSF